MEMKTLSEIAVSLINHIHDTLPDVDTKEGTFIRDVFIDPVSTEIADLYKELKLVEISQSILTATGEDLDRLARNFFIKRKDATYATGKVRFYIGPNEPETDIIIPQGTVVGTAELNGKGPLDYVTDEEVIIVAGDKGTYQFDPDTNMWYVDVDATAVEPGSDYNIPPNSITQLGDMVDSGIESVTNPFAFTGGTDGESDLSLMMRLSMAITGVNIGTKDGYKSFMLKQSEVQDAIVIGAGDKLMLRDNGEGGMVDIYVRAEGSEEHTMAFDVTYDYITGMNADSPYANIVLQKQPVLSVHTIVGKVPNPQSEKGYIEKVYINGSNYKRERGSERYYKDVKWNFTEVSTENLYGDELLKAKATNILTEKLKKVDFLRDVRYDIDWQLINPYADPGVPENTDFYRGYYSDALVYMITSKDVPDNPFVGGRNFISRNGEIYERIYVKPDFIIEKDTSHEANSIKAKDSIKWLPSATRENLPVEGETLEIKYSWDRIIADLQERLDQNRILTADVLIKKATEIPVEIKIEVVPEVGYSATTIKNEIIDKITSYINDMKKLGGSVDRSDIVYIARGTPGVEAVNLNTVHLSVFDNAPIQKLELKDYEYMRLESIYVKVLEPGTIV